jgi:biotin carboxyl carrier protein
MATEVTVPMVGKIVKMEMPIVAPVSGTIKEILVSPGQEVEADALLAIIE